MNEYVFAPQARQDLLEIWGHIALENQQPGAANKQLDRFHEKFAILAAHPEMGQARDDLRPGIRAFSAQSYVILYRAVKPAIEIVGVVHGAQNIEALFRTGQR